MKNRIEQTKTTLTESAGLDDPGAVDHLTCDDELYGKVEGDATYRAIIIFFVSNIPGAWSR